MYIVTIAPGYPLVSMTTSTAKSLTREYFIAKQANILAAMKRAKALLNKYLLELKADYPNSWPYSWDFNLLHDLEYRLTDRLRDLYSDYQDWHFVTFGWVAYDIK